MLDDLARAQAIPKLSRSRTGESIGPCGVADCHFVEPKSNLYALIIFSPELPGRGWFDRADTIDALTANRCALMHARQIILDILRTASAEPRLFEMADVAEHFQEGLPHSSDHK
jgi:hypothetical protein